MQLSPSGSMVAGLARGLSLRLTQLPKSPQTAKELGDPVREGSQQPDHQSGLGKHDSSQAMLSVLPDMVFNLVLRAPGQDGTWTSFGVESPSERSTDHLHLMETLDLLASWKETKTDPEKDQTRPDPQTASCVHLLVRFLT